jgi:hypothetical protein
MWLQPIAVRLGRDIIQSNGDGKGNGGKKIGRNKDALPAGHIDGGKFDDFALKSF